MSERATIAQFLEQFQPTDESVRKTLGLTERTAEFLWALLAATDEETLEIANANVILKRMKLFSSYLTDLSRRKAIRRGDKQGIWLVQASFVKKMAKLVDGEPIERDVPVKTKSMKAAKKTADDTPKANIGGEIGGMIAKLQAYVEQLQSDIVAKQTEHDAILRSLAKLTKQ